MSHATSPTAERRLQMLGEFAEMALSLAREMHQAALAAETIEERTRLADSFHRMGRGLRQSLALHARLERYGERAAEAEADKAASQARASRARRKAHVKGAVERLIWTEYEADDEDGLALADRLDAILDAEAETEDFVAADPDRMIAGLCTLLGLDRPPGTVGHTPSPHDSA